MDCTIGEELAEMAGQMRDHRNTVNNEKETATSSIEVTKRIRHEDDHGFRSLSNSANLDRSSSNLSLCVGMRE